MQQLGHIVVNGETICILYRKTPLGVVMVLRGKSNTGWLGSYLGSESEYLQDNPQLLQDLKDGKVIKA